MRLLLLIAVGASVGCQAISGEADRRFAPESAEARGGGGMGGGGMGGGGMGGGAELCADPVACGSCGSAECCEENCGQECTCDAGCMCFYSCPTPPCALHCGSTMGCVLDCRDNAPGTSDCKMEDCDAPILCADGQTVVCNTICP